jgi:multicomponent Na+:H+ antiporter subunit B
MIRQGKDVKGPESYIFKTVVRLAFFLINVLAVYLLLRGHALPGGGFIAGLATAISLILLSLALGFEAMHRVVRFDPVRVAAMGLILASLTGLLPVLGGHPFLEQFNVHLAGMLVLDELHVGTPLLFDLGVYLVVVGVTCKIVFVFAKSTQGLRALVEEEEARYSAVMEKPIESGPEAHQTKPRPGGKETGHAN